MIKKTTIFMPLFAVFVLYVMQVRWAEHDNQTFGQLYPGQEYGGFLLHGPVLEVAFALTLILFWHDIWCSVRQIPMVMLAVPAVSGASIAWSIDRAVSLNSLLLIVVLVGFAVLAARLLGAKLAFTIVWWLVTIACLFGSILALAGDAHALMGGVHEGQWRGLLGHKNQFGPLSVTLVAMTLLGGHYLVVPVWARLVVGAIAAAAAIASGSALAMVALAVAPAVGVMALFRARTVANQVLIQVAAALLAISLAAAALSFLGNVAGFLGRDLSLSGRVGLWAAALPFTVAAPFGSGIGTSGGQQVTMALRAGTGWAEAASAHNSYMRMALDLGWPVALLVFGYLLLIMTATRYAVPRRTAALMASLASVQLLVGMTEIFGGFYPSVNLLMLLVLSVAPVRAKAQRQMASQTVSLP